MKCKLDNDLDGQFCEKWVSVRETNRTSCYLKLSKT